MSLQESREAKSRCQELQKELQEPSKSLKEIEAKVKRKKGSKHAGKAIAKKRDVLSAFDTVCTTINAARPGFATFEDGLQTIASGSIEVPPFFVWFYGVLKALEHVKWEQFTGYKGLLNTMTKDEDDSVLATFPEEARYNVNRHIVERSLAKLVPTQGRYCRPRSETQSSVFSFAHAVFGNHILQGTDEAHVGSVARCFGPLDEENGEVQDCEDALSELKDLGEGSVLECLLEQNALKDIPNMCGVPTRRVASY